MAKEELLNNEEQMVEETPAIMPEETASPDGADPSGMVVDEAAEAPVTEEPVMEGGESGDDSGIAEYFPNVKVTEENREELTAAVANMRELQETLPILDKYRQVNQELKVLFDSEPGVGMAILDWRDGDDFGTALARHLDLENLAPGEGEPNREAWDNARNQRMQKFDEKQNKEKEHQENIQASVEALQSFQEEKGLADEDAQGFIDYMMEMLGAAYTGRLTPDFINRLYLAMNYDADMDNTKKEALEEGEIRGRNTKINQMKEKQDMEPDTGLPEIADGAAEAPKTEKSFGAKFLEDVF